MKRNCRIAVLLLTAVAAANSQENAVTWSALGPVEVVHQGQKFTAKVSARISPGWHIYSITQAPGGPVPTTIMLPGKQPFTLDGFVIGPLPHSGYDPNFQIQTDTYEKTVSFKVPLMAANTVQSGTNSAAIDVRFQACNETICLPPKTVHLRALLKIVSGAKAAAGSAQKTTPSAGRASDSFPASTSPPQSTAGGSSSVPPEQIAGAVSPPKKLEPFTVPRSQSLGSFIWLAAVMGALSLLTPCVFPMIPITVSYFTSHASGNRNSAIFTAIIYALGIVLTFSALGMLLALIFGAGGVNHLAANPWVNLLITAIFLSFAFSLFGAYFIQVPASLMDRMDFLTRNKEGGQVIGALLMGFAFTLTSFTCTSPFVGTLLVLTAQGNWRWPLAGMLAFSTVFAIPFFVLALAPQLMSRLPKAGGWMVSVKAVMGFLEIAAAMKFLSNADLVWHWGIFTRQVVLAVWVGIGVMTVLYVLGYFRMAHDSPVESIGAVRLTVAIVFLAVTVWLVPGLFGRQLGELESFLPPEVSSSGSPPSTSPASSANLQHEADWILNDYDGAMEQAKQENKLVFVDFTGYTCTNCRWMEANMFPRPEVAKEINKFVCVRLYTDGDGELYEHYQKMQQEKFGTVALPLYAILRTDGSPIATFPGLTRNTAEFLAFLQSGSQQ
jgi:thiol:disulfide interchange protein